MVPTFVVAGDSGTAISQRDLIIDFAVGADWIDFSGFDANPGSGGTLDPFLFLGNAAFNGAAEHQLLLSSYRNVTVLQGDINGDSAADFAIDLSGNVALSISNFLGVVAAPILIEASGASSLFQVGNNYALYATGTTSGPMLRISGANVYVGQFDTWRPIGIEQTASGYQVAWKHGTADEYIIWGTDSSGNCVANLMPSSSGSTTLK